MGITEKRLAMESDDKTAGKSRTLEEVAREIRLAGDVKEELKDEKPEAKTDPRVPVNPDAPADKVSVPPAATDDAVVTEPELAEIPMPEPAKKTPQEMQQDPKELLNPELDKPLVEEMGASKELDQAMKTMAEIHKEPNRPMERIDTTKVFEPKGKK